MSSRSVVAVASILMLIFLCAIYWPGLSGNFFYDDGPSILNAAGVKMETLSAESLRQAWFSGGAGPTGRPLAQLSFAFNYFFNGFDPIAFKLTNLLIHICCGWLVFQVVLQVLNSTHAKLPEHFKLTAAMVAAATWLLHPIQVLPVLHVVQRMTSMSALFLLAALHLHMQARDPSCRTACLKFTIAWLGCWPMAILSKETGALLPLYVLAWELIVRRAQLGQCDRFGKWFAAALLVCVAGAITYLLSDRAQWLWAGYSLRPFDLSERLLTEGRVMWFYLGLAFLPRLSEFGLYHDDIALSFDWTNPLTTLPSAVGLVLLAAMAWHRRKQSPLIAFGIAWFFIGHLMESTVLPLEIAHEHRNYVPLLGLILVPVGLVLDKVQDSKKLPVGRVVLVVASVLGLLSFTTALRAHQFGEEVRRTSLAAQYHSESAQANYEAGQVLAGLPVPSEKQGQSPQTLAKDYFEKATSLNPHFKYALLGQIHLACKTQPRPEAKDTQELGRRLQFSPFAPGDRGVLYGLKELAVAGEMCLTKQDIETLFAAAIANRTVDNGVRAMLWSWLADYQWLATKDIAGAKQALAQSLELSPGNPSNRLKWGQLQYISGELNPARKTLMALHNEMLSDDERKTLEQVLLNITMATNDPESRPQ